MKNVAELFESLIARARGETPPRVDVADRVVAILTAKQARRDRAWLVSATERPWMYLAAISSAAAIPAGLLAFLLYQTWADPLAELVEAISWVMQ